MKIKLLTRDGGFVHEAEIPPFNPPPEGVIWGTRFFVLQGTAQTEGKDIWYRTYREGMLYPVIDGQTTLPLG